MSKQNPRHFYFDAEREREFECHEVPSLSGSDSSFYVARSSISAEVVVFHEEYDALFNAETRVARYFDDGRAAAAWFRQNHYAIPSAAMRALRANELTAPISWPVVLHDLLRLRTKTFTASWSLSYESPDDPENVESFGSLREVYACLAYAGALSAVPGNSGSIKIGSVRIFSTHFRSAGLDQGHSHINPSIRSTRTDLYDAVQQLEQTESARRAPH